MFMAKKHKSTLFKSYLLEHKANPGKVDLLFDLYSVYQSEYKLHVHKYWSLFLQNKIKNNSFSHLGSTKHIDAKLNSAYLQGCLSQACASLNNFNANINTKFNQFINKSTIKDKDLLHKLRTINSKHAWLNNSIIYFPDYSFVTDEFGNIVQVDKRELIVDDFGNILKNKAKNFLFIEKSTLKLAKLIFKNILDKQRVRFPNLDKPRLLLDSRVYSLENSNINSFDYWLNISTLEFRKQVSIPVRENDFFTNAGGILGNTIELNFNQYDYELTQYKHNSLSKPRFDKNNKNKWLTKVSRTIDIIFNKQHNLEDMYSHLECQNIVKDKTVSFDLGLCNFIATSDGQLLGKYWLAKLKEFDKKIYDLSSTRQSLGLKTKSKRYDGLINQVRGFIKTETNRILNKFFLNNQNIETVSIEKLKFSSPELSKRLNRIIQNFGYKLFKDKLSDLSLFYGFKIEELNPAYTSQECVDCGYVAENNRKTQSEFECKCCGKKLHADVNGSRTHSKRLRSKQSSVYKTGYKGRILKQLKLDFVKNIKALLFNGKVGRRYLFNLLKENKYFKVDIKNIVKTTEASGVKPMTVLNYEEYLLEYYSETK
jgi:putative transposase